jgi:cysteine desulfurase/selenocysteine lyase
MDIAEARKLFPITENYAYLNHASVSSLSTRVGLAMAQVIVDFREHGGVNEERWTEQVEEARMLAARLINARPGEIALTDNTSRGLIIVANGLDWGAGDNVVTAETEFTANVYPWVYLRRLGVETRFAPARKGRILVEDVAEMMDEHTRLVALSFVEFGTGYRNDLAAIGGLCREREVCFSVDAIQGLGALSLDVRACQIDFLSAGGAKWLLGPVGTGVFYCRKGLIERLTPALVGWRSVVDRDDYYRYDSPLLPDARRFEPGTLNIPGLVGLGASLETLLEVGIPRIEERVLALTDHLIEGLEARGYDVVTPHEKREERSGIVAFKHGEHPADELHQRLREADVVISQRGGAIRVSPHFYNVEEELDRLLEALP